jgi:DNA-binding response OmpR family regulator
MSFDKESPKTVLIVDDSAANLVTLEALLEEEGFVVEALDSFEAAKDRVQLGPPVSLVVLDRGLGQYDGATLAPICTDRWPESRVVVLSGREFEAERLLPGVHATFTKGGDVEALIASLKSLVQ